MQLKSFKTTDGKFPYEMVYQHDTLGETKLKRRNVPKDIADMYHEIAGRVMEFIGLGSEKYGYFGFSLAESKDDLKINVTYCTNVENHPVACKVASFSVAQVDQGDIDALQKQAIELEDEYYNTKSKMLRKQKVIHEKLLDFEEMIGDEWGNLSAMDFADQQTDMFDEYEKASRTWKDTVDKFAEEGVTIEVVGRASE